MKMTERHSYAANAAQRQPVRVKRGLDNKSKGTLARQQDQTEDDWKRPQILPNRTLPDNGCSRFNRSARYHEQGRAVDACTFCNASTGLVKRTTDCRCRPHRRKAAGSSQEKISGGNSPSNEREITLPRLRRACTATIPPRSIRASGTPSALLPRHNGVGRGGYCVSRVPTPQNLIRL
jgi:hypothetical protein